MLEWELFLGLVNDIVYRVSLGEGEDPSTSRVEFVNQRVKELAMELVRENRAVLREL